MKFTLVDFKMQEERQMESKQEEELKLSPATLPGQIYCWLPPLAHTWH